MQTPNISAVFRGIIYQDLTNINCCFEFSYFQRLKKILQFGIIEQLHIYRHFKIF